MATKKKMLQAAAGNAGGGGGLNVEDVFSTYLYEGAGAAQTITNGIDLDGEGGIVWLKNRTSAVDHRIVTPEISPTGSSDYYVISNSTAGRAGASDMISSFNSDGFSLDWPYSQSNSLGEQYASWTWRKAPRFFDCVTYTGNGSTQTLNHSLDSVPGVIMVKRTDAGSNWSVYHNTLLENYYLRLNSTDSRSGFTGGFWGNGPTSTQFSVGNSDVNTSGATYVAYLFAHNNGDGDFGPDGDADIIKCGSYTGNSGGAIDVELGFEPQWLMIKNTSSGSNWVVLDVMRGFSWDAGNNLVLNANADHAEQDVDENGAPRPTPTGFSLASSNQYGEYNFGSDNYIYIAIRRGTKVPESGTEVFDVTADGSGDPEFVSGFPVDMAFWRQLTVDNTQIASRLTGTGRLYTNLTSAEGSGSAFKWDYMDGWYDGSLSSTYSWMWKRAPGFFDVVAYEGDSPGSIGVQTISHNLGVAPEMIWAKSRDSTGGWGVLATALGTVDSGGIEVGQSTYLNEDSGFNPSGFWGAPYVAPTSTEFTVRGNIINASGEACIAYLFASLDGISKVGSYTGNGSSQTIDCGFTSGARFVLIKRADDTGDWHFWDAERGIYPGNDGYLELNTTEAENTTYDNIDPDSSGFIVNEEAGADINGSGSTYIFYAIA